MRNRGEILGDGYPLTKLDFCVLPCLKSIYFFDVVQN